VTRQVEKHEVIFNHFLNHIGAHVPRSCALNLAELEWLPQDLANLEIPFAEEEVKRVIMEAPKENAPGPDGYIGTFFTHCWGIIKEELLKAINQFFLMNQQGLHLLNQALVVLIPKKEDACRVSDYMHISLTHSFTKLVSKLLANRLGPHLDHLISINQTSFIKRRCIRDNFLYVQEVIKDLHKRKIPALFLKLDISKAFDTVNWPYLLQIMEHLGFGVRWRNWISSL
jgi:hypothetical protein